MGTILPYLEKDLMNPNNLPLGLRYHNAVDVGGIVGGAGDFISTIIGLASGTTQQQLTNQQTAAQAQLMMAEAERQRAMKKGQNVAVIVGVSFVGLWLVVGTILYFKYRKG